MELSIYQLMAMRSLLAQGWPDSMVDILLNRCSLEASAWDDLLELGFIEKDPESRWHLSRMGKKVYREQKKGKWF